MGNEESKSKVNHHGDQQIRIINTQLEHSGKLEDHEFLLYVILAVTMLTLILNLFVEFKRYNSRKALKKAKSIIALTDIQIAK